MRSLEHGIAPFQSSIVFLSLFCATNLVFVDGRASQTARSAVGSLKMGNMSRTLENISKIVYA